MSVLNSRTDRKATAHGIVVRRVKAHLDAGIRDPEEIVKEIFDVIWNASRQEAAFMFEAERDKSLERARRDRDPNAIIEHRAEAGAYHYAVKLLKGV